MAQHDYVIANGTGAAVRSDLNGALAAAVSQNSGSTEPTTTYAYMPWADTTAGVMKMRNGANNGWITLFQLDGEWTSIAFENGTAAAPSIYFKDSGTDTGFFSGGTDQVNVTTGGTERVEWGTSEVVFNDAGNNYDFRVEGDTNANLLFVDASADAVGIGVTPSAALHVSGDFWLDAAGATRLKVTHTGGGDIRIDNPTSTLAFATGGTEAFRVDASRRVLVGTSTSYATAAGFTPVIQSVGTGAEAAVSISRYSANPSSPGLVFAKSRSSSIGGQTVVQSGDSLGYIGFDASDGTAFRAAAQISVEVDGTPGASDMPGRLVFSTTADGASSPTERMRIANTGNVMINETTDAGYRLQVANSSAAVVRINRNTNDGSLVDFYQDGTVEGSISVSGTTVSYNGAHLSRWSQLPSGAERIEILRGSVLSNIDEMCEWGDEKNEQLNRMKVSDIEGDKNVSGVFQAWDDDDDTYTNDFYCAMTGDFIIRIAADVTVERGDLLMSAGDGTAKPQDDDIIRSKTIAKVTSTNVSCTYDDGSYCVPCVLMAC